VAILGTTISPYLFFAASLIANAPVNSDGWEVFRLNSAGYITPRDMLGGHQQEVFAERDRKLEAAREQRKNRRQRAA
jgi:hypothetical protein